MSLPPSFVFQLAGVHGKGVFLLHSVDTVKIDLRSENGKWQCLTLKANHHNEQKKYCFLCLLLPQQAEGLGYIFLKHGV